MGKQHEEVEFKAGVDLSTLARLRRHRALRPATTGRATTRRLLSIYYDAGDLRLVRAGLFLRMRRTGGHWEQTVKAARLATPGLQRVTEITDPAGSSEPDPTRLSVPALRKALTDALAGAALQPIFRTEIQRTTRLLETADGRVELAFDRGSVTAGDAAEDICEVEIECIDGGSAPAWAWAQTLLAHHPARLTQPSKAARGFTLAAAEEPLRCGARSSNPTQLGPQRDAGRALEAVLGLLARAIADNLDTVFTSDDPEGPHQLRVALRRLRALLSAARPLLRKGIDKPLAREARHLGRLVGSLRDVDVTTAMLLDDAGDEPLAAALIARRESVRASVRKALCEAGATGFAMELLRLVDDGSWRPDGKRRRRRLQQPLAKTLGPALDAQWRRIERRGRHIDTLDGPRRHRLRKDLKVLRYTLEIAAIDPRASARAGRFKALSRLQDALGALSDAEALDRQPAVPDPAVAQALATARARLPSLKKKARRKELKRARRAWRRLDRHWHR